MPDVARLHCWSMNTNKCAGIAIKLLRKAANLRQTLAEIPATRFKGGVGRLAQLEEHLVYTERVGGSSPSAPTIPPYDEMMTVSLCSTQTCLIVRAAAGCG
jgi:hypothetical protein